LNHYPKVSSHETPSRKMKLLVIFLGQLCTLCFGTKEQGQLPDCPATKAPGTGGTLCGVPAGAKCEDHYAQNPGVTDYFQCGTVGDNCLAIGHCTKAAVPAVAAVDPLACGTYLPGWKLKSRTDGTLEDFLTRCPEGGNRKWQEAPEGCPNWDSCPSDSDAGKCAVEASKKKGQGLDIMKALDACKPVLESIKAKVEAGCGHCKGLEMMGVQGGTKHGWTQGYGSCTDAEIKQNWEANSWTIPFEKC